MQTDQRIWRTDDGRHVPDGHRDAAFLAYGIGDTVPDTVIDELTGDNKPKARRKPADKSRKPAEDKSADAKPAEDKPSGGLTINRIADKKTEAKPED